MRRALIAVAGAAILGGSAPAAADPDAPDRAELCWRYDLGFGAVMPIALQAYEDATSFGGRLHFRSTRGPLATQIELAILSRDNGPALEQVGYRARTLAGVRWRREPDVNRAIEVRTLAGVELVGLDRIDSDWAADRYGPGFAAEISVENRSRLDWGTVALSLGFAASVQPFGDEDELEARYVGLDILFGFALTL